MGELTSLFRYNGGEMNNSKITLDAQRPRTAVLWKRPNMYPMNYEGAYTKEQQRRNRENNKANRTEGKAKRDARTNRLCTLAGLVEISFSACKISINDKGKFVVPVSSAALLSFAIW